MKTNWLDTKQLMCCSQEEQQKNLWPLAAGVSCRVSVVALAVVVAISV